MSCVFPGVPEIFASDCLLVIIFINDDLPTLLRPINAYSGSFGGGHCLYPGLLIIYFADMISIK